MKRATIHLYARRAGLSSETHTLYMSRLRLLLLLAAAFWGCTLYFRASVPSDYARLGGGGGGNDLLCKGRYVYVHELPPRFNADILAACDKEDGRWTNMCKQVSNAGLGEPLLPLDQLAGGGAEEGGAGAALTGATGWYATQQFGLDAIFHARMRSYECLTKDATMAAAVFVPFYAGFEFVLHHYGYDNATRDAASLDLLRWLERRPEWRRSGGRDHFLVAGRTAWDFQRDNVFSPGWGTNLLLFPAARNITVLTVESSFLGNDMAVPYPTYFHPRTDAQVRDWQSRIRRAHRPWLMSFIGAPRPGDPMSIRSKIITQCRVSSRCSLLGCTSGAKQCHAPAKIMRLFRTSTFCIQPPGDSFTRRSAFDAMVAGCVPVFFHPASAYTQYTWHLPANHTRYSVFIPEESVRAGNVSIEETLSRIPPAAVREMQEEVVRLVPRLIYADPRYKLETVKDAFDASVEGMLRKVAATSSTAPSTAELSGAGQGPLSGSQENEI